MSNKIARILFKNTINYVG